MASVSHLGPIHLGLDVHRDTVSVAILALTSKSPRSTGFPTTRRLRRLVARLGDPRGLRACYEAGIDGRPSRR